MIKAYYPGFSLSDNGFDKHCNQFYFNDEAGIAGTCLTGSQVDDTHQEIHISEMLNILIEGARKQQPRRPKQHHPHTKIFI